MSVSAESSTAQVSLSEGWPPARAQNERLLPCVQVLNFKEFKVTECRAVQDFLLCFVVLQVAVFLLID